MAATNPSTKPLALALLPLLGAAIGAAGACAFLWLPPVIAAALVAIAWSAFARGGIAMLAIGAILRWTLLQYGDVSGHIEAMIASQAVPRAVAIVLAYVARPAGPGLASSLSLATAVAALAQGAIATFATGWRPALGILAGCLLLPRATQLWAYHSSGGVDARALAIVQLAVELWILALFY